MAFVGILFVSMAMDAHGEMSGMGPCPLMTSHSAVCSMSITEHLATIQKLFTVPLAQSWLFVAMLLLAVGATFPVIHHLTSPPLSRHITWRNTINRLFAYLRIALSRGIIQPRVYEPSL